MINEVLYMEIRLFNLFCERYGSNYQETNDIFNQNEIWNFIEETYDDLHLSSDELILDDICAVLKKNGVLIKEHLNDIDHDIKASTAELIVTDSIEDYSKSSGQSIAQIRNDIIESGAYEALFDFDTGLWKEGPDYFTAFYLEMKNKKSCQ